MIFYQLKNFQWLPTGYWMKFSYYHPHIQDALIWTWTILSSFSFTIYGYSNWPMYKFHTWPTLSCIYATAHTVPSKGNVLLCAIQNPSKTVLQRPAQTHELLNEVFLLPWSRNNLSPAQLPYHLVGIILLKLIIFSSLCYNYVFN